MFGDLAKGCVVGDAGGEKIDSSREFRFDYAQVALRMIFRFAYTSNANLGRALSVLKTAAA
jgi:hypothetical protein